MKCKIGIWSVLLSFPQCDAFTPNKAIQIDVRKFLCLRMHMSECCHGTLTAAAHSLNLAFRSKWIDETETNTRFHRLLDYGDYDEMKEFSIFMHTATATTTTTMTTTMDTLSGRVEKPQYFAYLAICHKYPDEYLCQRPSHNQPSRYLQCVYSQDIDKLEFLHSLNSLFLIGVDHQCNVHNVHGKFVCWLNECKIWTKTW